MAESIRLEDPKFHRTREEWDAEIVSLKMRYDEFDHKPYSQENRDEQRKLDSLIQGCRARRNSVRTYTLSTGDMDTLDSSGVVNITLNLNPLFKPSVFRSDPFVYSDGGISFYPLEEVEKNARGPRSRLSDLQTKARKDGLNPEESQALLDLEKTVPIFNFILEGETDYDTTRNPFGPIGTEYHEYEKHGGATLTNLKVVADLESDIFQTIATIQTKAFEAWSKGIAEMSPAEASLRERIKVIDRIRMQMRAATTNDERALAALDAIESILYNEHWLPYEGKTT